MVERSVSYKTAKNKEFDWETQTTIINNNYSIISCFDSVPEGYISKYLSLDQANKELKTKGKSLYTSYYIANQLAIIAIQTFNDGFAYVFNKDIPNDYQTDSRFIISNTYESLLNCYVFTSHKISHKYLSTLINEYFLRGGIIYEKYHQFDDFYLKLIRKQRQKSFRDEIVFDSIFKHNFREIGKNKWSNGSTIIEQKDIQRSSMSFPSYKQHTELDITLDKKILIGSIFYKYYKHINQLSDNTFGVVCNKDIQTYHFTYFEITFK